MFGEFTRTTCGSLSLKVADSSAKVLHLSNTPFDGVDEFVGSNTHYVGRSLNASLVFTKSLKRTHARNCFDSSNVGTDRGFADDLYRANIAKCFDMCTAAQFGGMRASFENLDDIAVLVTKERNGAYFFGFVFRRFVMTSRRVGENVAGNEVFDRNDFVVAQGFVMGEVETKTVRPNKRPLLFNVIAKCFPQCPMKQMRCSVIALDGVATFTVDDRSNGLTNFDIAFKNFEAVAHNARCAVDRFNDSSTTGRRGDHTGVANLSARFCVKRGVVEND